MSFETIVTGIRAASFNLEVIGNNITNAGTVAFKQSRANFAGVIQQALLGSGSGPETGVAVTGSTHAFSQGGIKVTENPLDMAINGNGFFTLRDGSGNEFYSRAGDFSLDPDGFVVNKTGFQLQAYLPGVDGSISNTIGSLRVRDIAGTPAATGKVELGANLDARQTEPVTPWAVPPTSDMYNATTSTKIFDSLGGEHKLDIYFRKTATPNTWDAYATIDGTLIGAAIPIVFGSDGVPDPALTPVTLNWTPAGAAAGVTTLTFAPLTQFSGRFAVSSLTQDGYTTGTLTGVKVSDEGLVEAQLSNGKSEVLGQVTLSKFRNNIALEPAGNNLWAATAASGPAQQGTAGTDGVGQLESGALEESNVDITEQLVEMITAQRNFQASVKALQTQDTITQSVINLR